MSYEPAQTRTSSRLLALDCAHRRRLRHWQAAPSLQVMAGLPFRLRLPWLPSRMQPGRPAGSPAQATRRSGRALPLQRHGVRTALVAPAAVRKHAEALVPSGMTLPARMKLSRVLTAGFLHSDTAAPSSCLPGNPQLAHSEIQQTSSGRQQLPVTPCRPAELLPSLCPGLERSAAAAAAAVCVAACACAAVAAARHAARSAAAGGRGSSSGRATIPASGAAKEAPLSGAAGAAMAAVRPAPSASDGPLLFSTAAAVAAAA